MNLHLDCETAVDYIRVNSATDTKANTFTQRQQPLVCLTSLSPPHVMSTPRPIVAFQQQQHAPLAHCNGPLCALMSRPTALVSAPFDTSCLSSPPVSPRSCILAAETQPVDPRTMIPRTGSIVWCRGRMKYDSQPPSRPPDHRKVTFSALSIISLPTKLLSFNNDNLGYFISSTVQSKPQKKTFRNLEVIRIDPL